MLFSATSQVHLVSGGFKRPVTPQARPRTELQLRRKKDQPSTTLIKLDRKTRRGRVMFCSHSPCPLCLWDMCYGHRTDFLGSARGVSVRQHRPPFPASAYFHQSSAQPYDSYENNSFGPGYMPPPPPQHRVWPSKDRYSPQRGQQSGVDPCRRARVPSPTTSSSSRTEDSEGEHNSPISRRAPRHHSAGVHQDVAGPRNEMKFKAAAEKLFLVFTKAEKFFDLFLRSFKQETSASYLDRHAAWQGKVFKYENDLILPVLREENASSGYNDSMNSNVDNALIEKLSFRELQLQIVAHMRSVSSSVPASPRLTLAHETTPATGPAHNLPSLNEANIKLEVQYEIAQALLRSVNRLGPYLEQHVENMHVDHHATHEALLIIKKLKCLLEQYKRGWQDEEQEVLLEG